MRAAVVLQKSIHQSKTRLKDWLSPEERRGIVEAMLIDVLSQLSHVHSLDYFGVVTRDSDVVKITQEFGGYVFHEDVVSGMNNAIHTVRGLLGTKVKQLLILPADVPLISAKEVDDLIQSSKNRSVTIIPCRRMTGTNGLLLSPLNVMDTAFGMDSMTKHCKIAHDLGLDYTVSQVTSLSIDVDTIEDLRLVMLKGFGTRTRQYILQSGIFDKKLNIGVTM